MGHALWLCFLLLTFGGLVQPVSVQASFDGDIRGGRVVDGSGNPWVHADVLSRYVRERQVVTLEDAVRKMSAATAQRMDCGNRGLLREGYMADIAVFDFDRVRDNATFADPHQCAVGIEYVFVNGVVVVDGGEHTGARPGLVLYGPLCMGGHCRQMSHP